MTEPHRCDEHCVCPDHGTSMWWGASQNLHACQDPTCRFARGWENHPDYEPWPGYLLPPQALSRHDAARLADLQAVLPAVGIPGVTPWWLHGDSR